MDEMSDEEVEEVTVGAEKVRAREVRIRLDVKQLMDVNLVAQTFTVHFQLEASWLEPEMSGVNLNEHPPANDNAEDVLKHQRMGRLQLECDKDTEDEEKFEFWAPRLALRNCTESCSEEMWHCIYGTDDDAPIVCCRWVVVGVFQEMYKLRSFPIDGQDLAIEIVTRWEHEPRNPTQPPVQLIKNQSGMYRSFCNTSNFSLEGEYELSSLLRFDEGRTNSAQSAQGFEYSLLTARLHLERHASYWVMNVVFPLMLITGCSVGSFVVDQKALADRCSITLTLLLAQVAYKYLVAEKLPKLGYATIIDGYVLFCFFCVFFTVIYQCFAALGLHREPTIELEDAEGRPVKVPLAPIVLFFGWFGLHGLCVLAVKVWRRRKRRNDPVWGELSNSTKSVLWIGPVDETKCNAAQVKLWLTSTLCVSESVPRPERVLVWSATDAMISMSNEGMKAPFALKHGFAVAAFKSRDDAETARAAYSGSASTLFGDQSSAFEGAQWIKDVPERPRRLKFETLVEQWAPLAMSATKKRNPKHSTDGGLPPWVNASLKLARIPRQRKRKVNPDQTD
jgi:hypothetical protein